MSICLCGAVLLSCLKNEQGYIAGLKLWQSSPLWEKGINKGGLLYCREYSNFFANQQME